MLGREHVQYRGQKARSQYAHCVLRVGCSKRLWNERCIRVIASHPPPICLAGKVRDVSTSCPRGDHQSDDQTLN